jgi:uroporphyrinogen-III synthase
VSGSLAGMRVANTRAVHQAAALDARLRAEGAIPVPFPCLSIEPISDTRELDAALNGAITGAFDWVLFTSVNTARVAGERLRLIGMEAGLPCLVAAVGRATADAVEQALGRAVDLIPAPHEQHAAALAAALPIAEGERVLIPASSQARPELAEALQARGATVTVVTAYETVPAVPDTDLPALLNAVDAVAFASPSAVAGFAERLAASGLEPEALAGLIVACIGPTTLAAARSARFPDPLLAREQSLSGIIELLQTAWVARSNSQQEAIETR